MPARYIANGFNPARAKLTPDGRWMAYDADESGRVEVYAQSYPNASVKRWKVSPANGSEPMWTRGGRELVYRKGDSGIAGGVDLENGRSGTRRARFAGPQSGNPGGARLRSYNMSCDGVRVRIT